MLVLQNINKVLQIVCKMSISTQGGKGGHLFQPTTETEGQVGEMFSEDPFIKLSVRSRVPLLNASISRSTL